MALRRSMGLRNALLGTGGWQAIMAGGYLDIYSGSQPVDANQIETGTKLCSITATSGTGGISFGTAASGSITKNAVGWSGTVLASGVAGWARLYDANKTTGSNGTAVRMDMSVGLSGADLVLTHTNLTADSVLTIKTFTITEPAE